MYIEICVKREIITDIWKCAKMTLYDSLQLTEIVAQHLKVIDY